MYVLGKIKVTTELPAELARLKDIAYNLWWSWNNEAIDLYREIDLPLWERLNKNPIRFLQEINRKKLLEKASDPSFMRQYNAVVDRFDRYMSNTQDTWYARTYPDRLSERIIYFSAEYGLHEVLPIYSGGLGVLSGDHCKTASDLGLPFTAVGLFYKQGYFNQRINREGWQETNFTNLNVSHLPVLPVFTQDQKPLMISVEMPGRMLYAKVWKILIGRVILYLMDTDVPENNQYDRGLTARLYGGDKETRIQQEILLGIGGIRMLDALGIKGTVYHMNEGHSAFMVLELCRKLIAEKNLTFDEAREVVMSSSVFTTHTPVPAGNDVFPLDMMDRYFSHYWNQLRLPRHEFINLGLKPGDQYNFNMTVLALNLSGKRNGVSVLHGAVSRNIYNSIWPGTPEDDVPIYHITNGIHTLTWLSPSYKYLYDKYLPQDWQERLYDPEVWEATEQIPDEELWQIHCALKKKMLLYIRDRLKEQYISNGVPLQEIGELDLQLDENAFTIGFARRFATYKRANLIFRDMARIERILNNRDMPVQIIFAGKAHPADRPAHEVIKHIHDISRQEGFRGKVFLVENYNMTLARNLVQGVDVWLNNPRRPLEASGTSGQKVSINGVLNYSISDGWWCEGYNGKNGWVIGDEIPYESEHHQDDADSRSLYNLLETELIPLYFRRDESGIPRGWIKMMKESIRSLTPAFSTHRMVQDYTREFYIPCIERMQKVYASNFSYARELAVWKQNIQKAWPQVQILADRDGSSLRDKNAKSGDTITLDVIVQLGSLSPDDVAVEVYYGPISGNRIVQGESVEMNAAGQHDSSSFRYTAGINISDGGEYGYTFRVFPKHPNLFNRYEMPFMKWAGG